MAKTNYGYRIMRKTLFDTELVDCHIGAYGFASEDLAVKDAKRRLQDEIRTEAIFTWSIQCYAYDVDTNKEKEFSIIRFPQRADKECVNET